MLGGLAEVVDSELGIGVGAVLAVGGALLGIVGVLKLVCAIKHAMAGAEAGAMPARGAGERAASRSRMGGKSGGGRRGC